MTTQLAPLARQQFFDNNGVPLAGGLLYTYAAGTTTPQATYTDSTGNTTNTNPIVLDARGSCALWLTASQSYKFNLTDSAGNQIPGWPVDNIQGGLFNAQQVTIGPPVSGPALTVNPATGWQCIAAAGTIQSYAGQGFSHANQNVNLTQVMIHGAFAEIVSINGAAGLNQKVWSNYADSSGNYNFRTEDDALSNVFTWLQVSRTTTLGPTGMAVTFYPGTQSVITLQQSASSVVAALNVSVGTTAGQSNGIKIQAGTNGSDCALQIVNAANTYNLLQVTGNGAVTVGGSGGPGSGIVSLNVSGYPSNSSATAVFGGAANNFIVIGDGQGTPVNVAIQASTALGAGVIGTSSNHSLGLQVHGNVEATLTSAGAFTISGGLGINGASAYGQVTGWGSPTGASVVSNFPGASATLVQCSNAIAKLITDLKGIGAYAA